MNSTGASLEALCAGAERELLLVAPFVKRAALERLLSPVSVDVAVTCVTRWHPHEIAVGVSDIDVWQIVEGRSGTKLKLRADLHAKYYCSEQSALIGSANMTNAALGWSASPNLEILVRVGRLLDFESELFRGCIDVDRELYERMTELVALADIDTRFSDQHTHTAPSNSLSDALRVELTQWTPSLRHPESLYVAYQDRLADLSTASRMAARSDLQALDLPEGLSQDRFRAYVSMRLIQMPVVRQVDTFVGTPRRFGAVTTLLRSLPCSEAQDFDANHAWQTLMRWLLYFLPNRYERHIANHSEIFRRVE